MRPISLPSSAFSLCLLLNQIPTTFRDEPKNLSYWLNQLKTDNSMYDSDMYSTLFAIGDSVRLAARLIETKRFICEHLDFYTDKKYDPARTRNGINIYKFLSGSVTRNSFVGKFNMKDKNTKKIVTALTSMGYVYPIGWDKYVTTTKFEQERLLEVYLDEHPEEKERLQKENALKKEQLYAAACVKLENKQYYDAAVDFCAAGDYADAAVRSVGIWKDHICLDGSMQSSLRKICSLHETGDFCVAAPPDDIADYSRWRPIVQFVMLGNDPYGLTVMGTVCALQQNAYNAGINVPGNGTTWKRVLQLAGSDFHLLGRHANGRVSAVGLNEHGECNVAHWGNVVKIAAALYISAGLRADGFVMLAGNPDICGQPRMDWADIVDIAVSYHAAVGLQKNGRVKAVGTSPFVKEVDQWENIVKIKAIGESIIGITAEGKVLYAGPNTFDKMFFACQENVVDAIGTGEASEYGSYWLVLHADGTVTTKDVHFDVSAWRDVVFVDGTDEYAYAVQRNGCVLFTGQRQYDEGSSSVLTQWRLFNDVNTFAIDKTNLIMRNIERQVAQIRQQLEQYRQELAQIKGIFDGNRKKQLCTAIAQLEAALQD